MRPEETLAHIKSELRSFVGLAFEQLARRWLTVRPDLLPFKPDAIGSHWQRTVQLDVVAINWQSKQLLLGECKWGVGRVSRRTVRELFESKGTRVQRTMGEEWTLHYAVFSREGLTAAAATEARKHEALVITMAKMDADFHRAASEPPATRP